MFRLSPFRSFRVLALCGFAAVFSGCAGGASAPAVPATGGVVPASLAQRAISPTVDPVYRKVVTGTHPIAFFPLDTANQGSVVGGYKTTEFSGAAFVKGGPIKDEKTDPFLSLTGQAYATTSLSGMVPGTGSIVAWVNLAELPSATGNYFYVAGESQGGNDFDLQFQNDDNLYFYTGSGENTEYVTNQASLVAHWNMIAVTYVGGSNGTRNIYWNGKLVAPFTGGVNTAPKTTQFSIGESLVFGNRFFQGGIDEVAVWNRALTTSEITRIYAAAK